MEEVGDGAAAGRSVGVVISAKQRARISENYRAAKALLDRKRCGPPPYSPTSPTIHQALPQSKKLVADHGPGFQRGSVESRCKSSVPHKLLEVNRVPLQEMEANTCKLKLGNPRLPLHANFGVPQPGTWLNPCNKSSIHGGLKQINKSEEVPRTVPTIDFPSSCLSSKDSSQDHRNNVTPLNSLIEEFDESFLQEIDTMLEQKYLEGPELRAPIQNGSIEQSMDPCAIAFRQQSVTNHDYTDTSDMSTETQLLLQDIHVHASAVDLPEKSTETLPALVKEEPEISAHELSTDDIRQTAGAQILASGCELTVPSKCVSSDSCLQEPCFMANQNHPTDDLFSKYFQTLNDMQREAATSDITVPLMIVAGPGSGKTSTIVGRVLMLLKEGIAPSNILAMTFTTAAASEMRERIGNLAGKSIAKEFTICTFHSLCLQLCRAHAEKLQRTSDFSIYGTGQQRRAVIEAVRLTEMSKTRKNNVMDQKLQGNSTEKDFSAISFKKNSKKWQKFVAMAKASGKTVNDYHNLGYEQGAEILRHYDNILKSCNALDYYDFISLSLKLLTDFPEVHKQCQDLWKAIVVDEFQDTSALQYHLLRVLGSHHCITVVGDEDQSIFSFNGADVSGFDSFRKDFPGHKEVRLQKNYRSTQCIVEASLSLIQNNKGRCHLKQVMTDNDPGSKISIIECHSEDAQCSFVIDKIMEMSSEQSVGKCSFGSIAILYRRQVSGRLFQSSFRNRKIPYNVHGVAFYRKKVVKAIVAMLKTALPGCEDGPYRQVFKALFLGEKAEKKKVVDYIDKVSAARKCSFFSTACDVFTAKVSGTFTRNQLNQGRKVLLALDMISKLVQREPSISLVVSSIANLIPQKYLLDQRAVVDADGGKLLNEDSDLRNVMQYLLDDVSEFLRMHCNAIGSRDGTAGEKGCIYVLKMFIDYVSGRENDNFRSRRIDNENSVSLTTIHQSKGLEWDTVFIIKANDCEIPLLHDADGFGDNSGSVEEERRLLYVAMTRARKRLYILYALMDANWQVLQPSRFLKELPPHLLEIQDGSLLNKLSTSLPKDQATTPVYKNHMLPTDQTTTPVYKNPMLPADQSTTPVYKNHMLPEDQTTTPVYKNPMSPADQATTPVYKNHLLPEDQTTTPVYKNHMLEIMKKDPDSDDTKKDSHGEPIEIPGNLDIDVFKYENEDTDACIGNHFLRRFNVEDRSSVSHLFHTWAKKQAFQDPKRLLDKVGCVVDERLRSKKSKNKSILQALRSSLKCDEAFQYAQYVLTWEEIPADKRAQIMREKQEYFQKLRIEASMSSSAATPKQISYLQKLGCAITPTSRLHASNLIEQYKSL